MRTPVAFGLPTFTIHFTRQVHAKFTTTCRCTVLFVASLVFLPIILLLSGCAHYEAKPLSAEASAADFDARNLDDPNLKAFIESTRPTLLRTWPLFEWDFTNLTYAAFYYHPDLQAERARWNTARAKEVTAGQRPNPSVGVVPGYNTTESIPSPWLINFTFDVPIETAGKRSYRVAQAQHLSEEARLNMATTAWRIRGNCWASLLRLTAARESLALLEELRKAHTRTLELLESRLAAGAISPLELTQA